MNEIEATRSAHAPNVLKWVLSSGLVATGVAIWGSLLGLLYRIGWLSAFGVSEDLFIPTSATELTYWGYVAALELWSAVGKGLYDGFFQMAGVSVLSASVGLLLGFLSLKYKSAIRSLLQKKGARVSLSLSAMFGTVLLYPFVIFLAATTVLLLPFPAYSLGKKSAERTIEKYRQDVSSSRRNCHVLVGPNGQVGACPMVIAHTKDRIAFLDGMRVHVISTPELQINWALPPLTSPQRSPG